jgi:hypothetical protein
MTVVVLADPHPSIRCSTAFRSYSGCSPTIISGEAFSQNQNAISILHHEWVSRHPQSGGLGWVIVGTPSHPKLAWVD